MSLRDGPTYEIKFPADGIPEIERQLRADQLRAEEDYRWLKFRHLLETPRRRIEER